MAGLVYCFLLPQRLDSEFDELDNFADKNDTVATTGGAEIRFDQIHTQNVIRRITAVTKAGVVFSFGRPCIRAHPFVGRECYTRRLRVHA